MCIDGTVSFIGSTNLCSRSFNLNFENNVLLQDDATTQAIIRRQQRYLIAPHPITLEQVRAIPL